MIVRSYFKIFPLCHRRPTVEVTMWYRMAPTLCRIPHLPPPIRIFSINSLWRPFRRFHLIKRPQRRIITPTHLHALSCPHLRPIHKMCRKVCCTFLEQISFLFRAPKSVYQRRAIAQRVGQTDNLQFCDSTKRRMPPECIS